MQIEYFQDWGNSFNSTQGEWKYESWEGMRLLRNVLLELSQF